MAQVLFESPKGRVRNVVWHGGATEGRPTGNRLEGVDGSLILSLVCVPASETSAARVDHTRERERERGGNYTDSWAGAHPLLKESPGTPETTKNNTRKGDRKILSIRLITPPTHRPGLRDALETRVHRQTPLFRKIPDSHDDSSLPPRPPPGFQCQTSTKATPFCHPVTHPVFSSDSKRYTHPYRPYVCRQVTKNRGKRGGNMAAVGGRGG